MSVNVTQRIEFECSYIFNRQFNSHRYRLEVTVGTPSNITVDDDCTVIDFKVLRSYMQSVVFDNTFVYDGTSDNPGRRVGKLLEDLGIQCLGVSFTITCENLCQYFVKQIEKLLNEFEPYVHVINAKLRENSESFTEWSR